MTETCCTSTRHKLQKVVHRQQNTSFRMHQFLRYLTTSLSLRWQLKYFPKRRNAFNNRRGYVANSRTLKLFLGYVTRDVHACLCWNRNKAACYSLNKRSQKLIG